MCIVIQELKHWLLLNTFLLYLIVLAANQWPGTYRYDFASINIAHK